MVEARLDVTFQDPLIRAGRELVDLGDRVLSPAPGAAETRRSTGWKPASRHRLEDQLQGPLARCGPARSGHSLSRRRLVLPGLGIIRSRTGIGVNCLSRRSLLRSGQEQLLGSEHWRPGGTPSTPADRLPRLPLTRVHATTRTAGSHTRLNTSSRSLSDQDHRPPTDAAWPASAVPAPRPLQASATAAPRYSPASSCPASPRSLPDSLPPFPM